MIDIQDTRQKARALALECLREKIGELHAKTEHYSSEPVRKIGLDLFREKINKIDEINTLIYNLDQIIDL